MKKLSKVLALLLALVMTASLFAGCGGTEEPSASAGSSEAGSSEATEPQEAKDDTPLVVGYSAFSNKFSPFFSETAYDQDVYAMTSMSLLTSDRQGAIVEKGKTGETRPYNGTDYTYYGPADLTITQNADGTVFYDFELRDDITFSDGEPVTVDDVIFSMYVLCDPSYDGSSTLYAQPIQGMEAYRSDMKALSTLLVEAGRDNADFTLWDEATQTKFWADYDAAAAALAQEIVDYCVSAGYAADANDVQTAADAWGFSPAENTIESFAAALQEKYGADIAGMINTENAGSTVDDLFPNLTDYTLTMVTVADPVTNIAGIQKTGDNTLRIVMDKFDATAIYHLGIVVAPMHYYGETEKYDYENNKFGFDKGDLSHVRSVTTQPLGAGPYKFIQFKDGVVNFEANETYYLGTPKTKYINFLECLNDGDKLNGIITGTIDIADPSFSTDNIAAIEEANGGELVGPVITTNTVDNLGYGYIGQCAKVQKVGNDPYSEESKALRKAYATILAVYRDVAIDSYYGDRASVINYPISNTSWAAPQSSDDGYRVAFSVDVNGNDIYTSDMTDEQKYAAAKEAALGFFEKAGFTVENGKVTAAPEGASLEVEAWIPADGVGDHPAFMIFSEAQKAFEEIGITFKIKDLSNSSDLWTALSAQSVAIWAAAWGATPDPDMYQIYYADVANGGANPGGSNYQYAIADAELDKLILEARASADQAYRKAVYKTCLDIIIDQAVEIPTYQRQNAVLFSTERVNLDTITPDITTFYGWMSEIQNTELN